MCGQVQEIAGELLPVKTVVGYVCKPLQHVSPRLTSKAELNVALVVRGNIQFFGIGRLRWLSRTFDQVFFLFLLFWLVFLFFLVLFLVFLGRLGLFALRIAELFPPRRARCMARIFSICSGLGRPPAGATATWATNPSAAIRHMRTSNPKPNILLATIGFLRFEEHQIYAKIYAVHLMRHVPIIGAETGNVGKFPEPQRGGPDFLLTLWK